MNKRMIVWLLGALLLIESGLMLLPLVTALLYREQAGLYFLYTILGAAAAGGLMMLVTRPKNKTIYARDGLMTVALSWIVLSLAGALLLGVPVALLTAVYLAFFCPKGLYRVLKPAVELLAGIPSVVYGFFGIVVLVPAVRALGERWDGSGNAMLTASILLAMMILPTIIGVVEPALRAVPTSDYEGALALGATHERSVYTAVVPAAKSGILAGIVLGVGRAMGETMAVIMVAGNQPRMPKGILQGVRTLTGNIVIEMGYATGLHREALIATGVVLFVFILLINLCFSALKRGKKA